MRRPSPQNTEPRIPQIGTHFTEGISFDEWNSHRAVSREIVEAFTRSFENLLELEALLTVESGEDNVSTN